MIQPIAQALVPLKDLVQAKSRLAGLLRPSERRALAQAMAEDVLATLAGHCGIGRVTLVSDDSCAALLAQKHGAVHWSEHALGCRGLNAVVACASARVLREGAEPLLVLHGDLPLLSPADLSAVLACQRRVKGLVIGCDSRGTGTNLLAFSAEGVPTFCFGANSCERHQEAARASGIPSAVLQRPGIALDIDEPRDLAALLSQFAGTDNSDTGWYTAGLLRGTALGARIELALSQVLDRYPGSIDTPRQEAKK